MREITGLYGLEGDWTFKMLKRPCYKVLLGVPKSAPSFWSQPCALKHSGFETLYDRSNLPTSRALLPKAAIWAGDTQ
jgi:hypothetical protein